MLSSSSSHTRRPRPIGARLASPQLRIRKIDLQSENVSRLRRTAQQCVTLSTENFRGMMADDGMLVNFSLDADRILPQTKFKGGSWKDRFLVKKAARYRAQKRASGGVAGPSVAQKASAHQAPVRLSSEDDYPTSRPAKRRKEGNDLGHNLASTEVGSGSTQEKGNNSRTRQVFRPRDVVSSLFSYNPISSVTIEDATTATEVRPTKPSNAPLVDGIDTFTTLGLSPSLAAHLLTKMDLKNPTAIQRSSVTQLVKEDSDAFVQSETGSGKTLAYLLPIVQRIMTLSEQYTVSQDASDGTNTVHRASGLFAIVLAPTRELCKQISVVLERLLGCAHWIVGGTVIGGEKKKSEKARLRKGVNILVATPGRLVDHLENTKVLDVSNVRWLVLDEGDRLMDLGFEEDISKIVGALDKRQKKGTTPGLPDKRTTVLCSATMKMNVQRLGDISLKNAVLIKAEESNDDLRVDARSENLNDSGFLAPAQLKQSYVIAAAKLRLVTLAALLKRTFARKGSVMKAIVFVSCADSVEFHFKALTRELKKADEQEVDESSSSAEQEPASTASKPGAESIRLATLLSDPSNPLNLFKLHGSLPQPVRTSIVKAFSAATTPSLLLATDVASRGLDLPNLDLVIEYDPPFNSDDHLHRIGRTARLGRDGRAVIFLLPGAEEGYVGVLKSSYKSSGEGGPAVTQMDCNDVLKRGFGSAEGEPASKVRGQSQWEHRATEFQLDVERWVLASPQNQEMARKAFQSHVRAYATHVAAERKWFDIKTLHLGHLAKAFGLRDAPGRINVPGLGQRAATGGKRKRYTGEGDNAKNTSKDQSGRNETTADAEEAARKMKEKVRNKRMMTGGGADEFNIA